MSIAVVVITHNRVHELTRTLEHLVALDEADQVVVVDNGSSDGTDDAVRTRFPAVTYLACARNIGCAARNLGVAAVAAPHVAFADDDMQWEQGSLARADTLLANHRRVGLVAARVVVGPDRTEDGVCREMANSPLPSGADLPGPRVLGCLAGASIVRRDAFVEVGGFHRAFMIGGEEELLACDLNMAGWDVVYCPELTTWHRPSARRDSERRRRVMARNAMWFAWLRMPPARAIRRTLMQARRARSDRAVRSGLADAMRGLPWVLRERRTVPSALAADYDRLSGHGAAAAALDLGRADP